MKLRKNTQKDINLCILTRVNFVIKIYVIDSDDVKTARDNWFHKKIYPCSPAYKP